LSPDVAPTLLCGAETGGLLRARPLVLRPAPSAPGRPPHLTVFSSHTDDPWNIWGDPNRQRRVWAAHDPTALAARLRGTRLFVSAGYGRPGPFDEPGQPEDVVEATVYREGRAFARRLRRLHIPVEADFYGHGVHDWPYWERELERSLPLLLGARP
jgi:diacylglycerol O-acyltransferase / trehalose O-mycolyltransferase